MKPLEVLQRKIVLRLNKVFDVRINSSVFFKSMKLLKLRDVYTLSSAIYIYKINHLLCPKIIQDHITANRHTHHYNTRQPQTYLHRPASVLVSSSKAFSYSGVDIWNNNVPVNIKTKPTLTCFKKHLKSYLISSY